MAKDFGKTWWGKSWLNALSKIDYDNRIPRGRRYANNGSVKTIEIKKNMVTAKVQGSRPSPYKVEVNVPNFSPEEKTKLKEQIKLNPQVYAAMLNKELSPDIEVLAKEAGINLFPQKWSDLQMSCSCPDWAVPCKHLAAVIYKVGDAIDRDPWLFFQLRGLDLQKEFDKSSAGSSGIVFHKPEQFFWPKMFAAYPETTAVPELRSLDLSQLPFLRSSMYKLLTEAPLFWKGDFREEWDDRLATTTKNFHRWSMEIDTEARLPIEELKKGHQIQLFLNTDLQPTVVGVTAPRSDEPVGYTVQDLILTLAAIGPDDLLELDPSAEAIWHVYALCQALVAKGAIRPMLVQTGANAFQILWTPCDAAKEVAELVRQVTAAIPANVLWKIDPLAKKEAYLPVKQENAATLLSSIFLCMIVSEFSVDTPEYYRARRSEFDPPVPTRDPILDLFFGGMAVGFSGFESDSVPAAIHKWLGIFELGQRNFRPVLEVEPATKGAFTVKLALEPVSGELHSIPFQEFLEGQQFQSERISVLRSIHLLANIIQPIHEVLKNGGTKPVAIDPHDLLEVLLEKLPLVELIGVQVLLPKALRDLVRPRPSVKIDAKKKSKGESISLGDIFSFDWQVSLGDTQMSPEEFFKLIDTTHGLVKIRDQYVLIQPDELDRMRKRFEKGPRPTGHQLIHAALTGEFEGTTAHLTPAVVKAIKELTEIRDLPTPKGIQAKLRPYQQRGFAWMYKNSRLGLGSVIADDMGLGKTLQVLCLLEKLREEGKLKEAPGLVVVPTSLLANWKKEAQRFAPNLKTVIFHGPDRKFPKENFDMMVTTYGTLRSDLAAMKKKKWGPMVIDEAQNIKNADTAQSKAVRAVPASLHIAMSGTPVENRLSDYWSIFDFALPDYLGNQKYFKETFSIPITKFRDPKALKLFHGITAPFIMRRVKTDPNVISDLPDKISHNQWCGLEKEQAAIYKNVVNESLNSIGEAEGINRRGLILKMLTALKQVCNHPAQYLQKGKVISESSGKAAALLPLLENIVAQHEKCLIFTQYTTMGTMLQTMLKEELGIEASFLHGALNPKQREALVTEFQEESHRKVFILSLKAGGTGLNLTAANHVIHYDLWWNPAVENQATDRAFRIGQKKNVMVHRMICKGTLEERIDELLIAKKELADLTVSQGENWIGDLSNADLQKLVALDSMQ